MSPAALLAAALLMGNFRLSTTEGERKDFAELRGNITVVVFISTVCPMSNDYADRFSELYRRYNGSEVRLIFINSNKTETAAEVKAHAEANEFPFPVYKDAGDAAADAFGAEVTPTAYVLDAGGTVRYRGRIDDSANPARVKQRPLRDAIEAVLAGRPVAVTETKPYG